MPEEMDPGDALRELLQQRERAKKAVYTAALAREKAEEDLAHREKLFQMQIEETQKLASENAGLRMEKEEAVARVKLVEDAAVVQALKFDKVKQRASALEGRLARLKDVLDDSMLEDDEPAPEEEPRPYNAEKMRIEAERRIDDEYDDEEEEDEDDFEEEEIDDEPESVKPKSWNEKLAALMGFGQQKKEEDAKSLKRSVLVDNIRSLFSAPAFVAIAAASPFTAMLVCGVLLSVFGIKVGFVSDIWVQTTWMSDQLKNDLTGLSWILAIAAGGAGYMGADFVMKRKNKSPKITLINTAPFNPGEPPLPEPADELGLSEEEEEAIHVMEDKDEKDDAEYQKQLDELFGKDEDAEGP